MHVRWKKKRLSTNRQNGEVLCPHNRIKRPVTITPAVMVYQKGHYRTVWRPGPSIRLCCLNKFNTLAFAAWWKEVDTRFKFLAMEGCNDPLLAQNLLAQQEDIVRILADKIPYPSYHSRRAYEKVSARYQTRKRMPISFKILGLNWPCSSDALRDCWRELAQKHHPDKGGDPQEFIHFKQAYEDAKRILETPA